MTWPIPANLTANFLDNSLDDPAQARGEIHSIVTRVNALAGALPRVVSKSAAYNIQLSDVGAHILCDTTLAPFTLTLPEAVLAGNGFVLIVTKSNNNYKALTINPYGSELINGRDSLDIDIPYSSVKIMCTSTQWIVTAMSGDLFVDARSYGILPGLADVTTAMNNALLELQNTVSTYTTARSLFFRSGIYKMHDVAWQGIPLIGENAHATEFRYNGTSAAAGTSVIDCTKPSGDISFARVENIRFEGWDGNSGGAVAEYCFRNSGNSQPDLHFHFRNCSFIRCWGDGLDQKNTRGLVNFHLERIRFDMVGRYGVAIAGSVYTESRPFSMKRCSYDNNIGPSGFETALTNLGLYGGDDRWGNGLLHIADSRGLTVKLEDVRIECNKNLKDCVPGKKALIYCQSIAAGGLCIITLDNLTGFARKPDGAILVYDEADRFVYNERAISVAYLAKHYESELSDWRDIPGGINTFLTGGVALGSTATSGLVVDGNVISGLGINTARPGLINEYIWYKKGDIKLNTDPSDGEPAYWTCTEPVTGYAINIAMDFTVAAVVAAGSTTINVPTDPDAFRYFSKGVNIIIRGGGVAGADLVTRITSASANTKAFVVADAPSSSVDPCTIASFRPVFLPVSQIGYRTTNGSPQTQLTAKYIGEEVLDTTNLQWYKAADYGQWKLIG